MCRENCHCLCRLKLQLLPPVARVEAEALTLSFMNSDKRKHHLASSFKIHLERMLKDRFSWHPTAQESGISFEKFSKDCDRHYSNLMQVAMLVARWSIFDFDGVQEFCLSDQLSTADVADLLEAIIAILPPMADPNPAANPIVPDGSRPESDSSKENRTLRKLASQNGSSNDPIKLCRLSSNEPPSQQPLGKPRRSGSYVQQQRYATACNLPLSA